MPKYPVKKVALEWKEPGLSGIIPDVPAYWDDHEQKVVGYPPACSAVIKAWREAQIEKRGLKEKRAEDLRIKAAAESARDELKRLENLGLLDEDGCVDDVKYEAYLAANPTEEL